MRNIPISKFKAHALGLVKAIAETGEGVIVTKRGVPLVRVEPYAAASSAPQPGKLAGTIASSGDLIKPASVLAGASAAEEGGAR